MGCSAQALGEHSSLQRCLETVPKYSFPSCGPGILMGLCAKELLLLQTERQVIFPLHPRRAMDFYGFYDLCSPAHLQSETNGAAGFLSFLSFYISSGFKKEGSLSLPWQAADPELCGSTLSRPNSPRLESYEQLVQRGPYLMVRQTTTQGCTAGKGFLV